MFNYICADLRRIYRRLPRLILLALIYIIVTAAFADALSAGEIKAATLMIIFEHYVLGYFPLVIGLVEMSVLYSDDFRAKTMQQAIGMGISRTQVVLCKLLDMAVLMLVDILVFGAAILAAGGIWGAGAMAGVTAEFLLSLLSAWLKSVAYASLAMTLAFYTQNALFSMLVYIALASGVANTMLGMALGMKSLAPLHLSRFLLTAQANVFYTHALLGSFDLGSLLAVLIYIGAGAFVSSWLFKNVELEL